MYTLINPNCEVEWEHELFSHSTSDFSALYIVHINTFVRLRHRSWRPK